MIEEVIEKTIQAATAKSFTLFNAEEIAFAQFKGEKVSVRFVAEHLNVHENTVRNAVKYKKLMSLPRLTDKAKFLFDKAYILRLKRSDII